MDFRGLNFSISICCFGQTMLFFKRRLTEFSFLWTWEKMVLSPCWCIQEGRWTLEISLVKIWVCTDMSRSHPCEQNANNKTWMTCSKVDWNGVGVFFFNHEKTIAPLSHSAFTFSATRTWVFVLSCTSGTVVHNRIRAFFVVHCKWYWACCRRLFPRSLSAALSYSGLVFTLVNSSTDCRGGCSF